MEDILDLKYCTDGVQQALQSEDYEKVSLLSSVPFDYLCCIISQNWISTEFVWLCKDSMENSLWLGVFISTKWIVSLRIIYVFWKTGSPPEIWIVNSFPNKPWFLRVCNPSLLKTLWEKEKLLITSNFSFSHSVFYPLEELSAIFIKFEIVVCKLFGFGSLKFVVWERVKSLSYDAEF